MKVEHNDLLAEFSATFDQGRMLNVIRELEGSTNTKTKLLGYAAFGAEAIKVQKETFMERRTGDEATPVKLLEEWNAQLESLDDQIRYNIDQLEELTRRIGIAEYAGVEPGNEDPRHTVASVVERKEEILSKMNDTTNRLSAVTNVLLRLA